MDLGRFTGGFGGTRLLTVLAFAAMPQFLLPQSYEGLQRQVLRNAARLCLAPIAVSQTICWCSPNAWTAMTEFLVADLGCNLIPIKISSYFD